ncbi:MAG TPA: cupredoxin domain-containing protein [Actinomycetota bacterium]|nr:cupredoxin domain-containing protein [Actinomycetota bacterium]
MSRTRVLVPLAILFAVLSLATTASAGGGGCHNPQQTDRAGTTVDVGKNCFGPTVLRVAQGQTVTWFNYDPIVHTITAAGGLFDKEIQPEETYTFKFTSAGVYPYYCLLHARMAGAVVVGDNDGKVVATAPQPVAALTAKPEDGTSPTSAALIAAFIAAPLSFVAGRILRGRRQPS